MFFIKNRCTFLQAVFLFLSLSLIPFQAQADTTQYFYDETGRLTQVTNNGIISNYNYDEVGNIISVVNGSLASIPSITNTSPTTLLAGARTRVLFTGSNLLSAGTITSQNGNITINNVSITENTISALVTASSAGTDTLTITFRDNNSTTYQASFSAIEATLIVEPPYIVIPPNTSTTISVSINPPQLIPILVNLQSSDMAVATVANAITVPAGSSVPVQVNTLATGTAFITSLNNVIYTQILSEKQVGADGVSARPVSVMIELAVQQPPPSVNASPPVSVMIEPTLQAINPSVRTSAPVSVLIEPSANVIAPSVKVSPSVSTAIAQ